MGIEPHLLSIGELISILSEYSNDYKIDFGDKFITKIVNNGSNILIVDWISKAEQEAINVIKIQEENDKYLAATSISIEESGLGKKHKTLLKSAGINTIYQLAQNFPEELTSSIYGFGWKSIDIVAEELERNGWYWGGHRIEEIEKKVIKSKVKRIKHARQ